MADDLAAGQSRERWRVLIQNTDDNAWRETSQHESREAAHAERWFAIKYRDVDPARITFERVA